MVTTPIGPGAVALKLPSRHPFRARDSNRPFSVCCRYTNEHPEAPGSAGTPPGAERHMEEAMHAVLDPTTVPWPH